jgi:hypothetical protein
MAEQKFVKRNLKQRDESGCQDISDHRDSTLDVICTCMSSSSASAWSGVGENFLCISQLQQLLTLINLCASGKVARGKDDDDDGDDKVRGVCVCV